MKTHNAVIAVLICASLVSLSPTSPSQAQSSGPKIVAQVVCGILVIGVGVVIYFGLKKMCANIPSPGAPPTPPPAPPTNPPPIMNPTNSPPSTNKPPWWKRIFNMTDNNASAFNISTYSIVDIYGAPKDLAYYHTLVSFTLQSSTNLVDWRDELSVTQWVSDYGVFNAYYQGGSNVLNTYSGLGTTNYVPLSIGTGDEPMKVFRVGN